jgi:N-formylglutamate deformylase
MEGFSFSLPQGGRTPLMVEVPHAGTEIPDALRDELLAPHESVLRDADLFVDKLYEDAPTLGASLLCAKVSRYVVDLNRAPNDVDLETVHDHPAPRRAQPRGVVWRVTADGRPLLRSPLDYGTLQRRLAAYHTPYHDLLAKELVQLRAHFGFAVLIAAHSMPSAVRRNGRDIERRADVVPGSLGRTSAHPALIDLVDSHFRSAGLSVRHDDPCWGGYTTAHYGRPAEGIHVVQIELNRALYMDEATCRPKAGDFEQLRKLTASLVSRLHTLTIQDLT